MESGRATWTDERLDDLANRMDDGFERVDRDIRDLSARLDARTEELSRRIDAQGDEVSRRIDSLDLKLSGQIASLQRLMVQFGGGLTLAVLATLVSVLATRA